ncbi:MAG: aminopeptidase P family protein [Theionarchaea archaeon]|nr:aminopeptidase P family protein [Theionarchaea archaeon]
MIILLYVILQVAYQMKSKTEKFLRRADNVLQVFRMKDAKTFYPERNFGTSGRMKGIGFYPPRKEFTVAPFNSYEYKRRIENAKRLMEEKGIDVLLITEPVTIDYFTGFRKPFPSKHRPRGVLIPLDGEPVMVIAMMSAILAEKSAPWLKDIRKWGGPPYMNLPFDPLDVFIDIVQTNGYSKVGMELGHLTRMDMSNVDFEKIKSGIGSEKIVDGSEVIWECRKIKSRNEIEKMARCVHIMCEGYRLGFESLEVGMTERDVASLIWQFWVKHGCFTSEVTGSFLIRAGKSRYSMLSSPPVDRKFERGDVIFFDGGPNYEGYQGDIIRLASIGEPNDRQKKAFKIALEKMDAGLEAMVPGNTWADVALAAQEAEKKAGVERDLIRRHGHGIGMDLHEPPNIYEKDATPVEPGNTVSYEPAAYDYPEWQVLGGKVEEQIVITEHGPEILSKELEREMWIL